MGMGMDCWEISTKNESLLVRHHSPGRCNSHAMFHPAWAPHSQILGSLTNKWQQFCWARYISKPYETPRGAFFFWYIRDLSVPCANNIVCTIFHRSGLSIHKLSPFFKLKWSVLPQFPMLQIGRNHFSWQV